jgi:DNA-binding response OmpR family regulator
MNKILIIDDIPENVFLLQDRLEHENYEVITAYDGETGIQKALSEEPDLILLDIVMPGLSGIEVCKTLTHNPDSKDIPIILVSAKSDAEDLREGLLAGAFDYIKKPVNRVELLARVNSALKLRESHKILLDSEAVNTFTATVVTANHKIKQPLTLMNLSLVAIRRELAKEDISREAISKRLEYFETAIKEINNVLEQLNTIRKPVFSDYTKNIKMISLDQSDEESKAPSK